jgi:hypothetical protein
MNQQFFVCFLITLCLGFYQIILSFWRILKTKTLNVILLMKIMRMVMILILRMKALAMLLTVIMMLLGPLTDLEREEKLSRCNFSKYLLKESVNLMNLLILYY